MGKYVKVVRIAYRDTYTIGKLYVKDDKISDNWSYLCDTLEDKYRGDKLDGIKVFGQTAIPKGVYKGVVDYSNHFKQKMPHILNVPQFEGIRIHSGNTAADTEGCILVGYNKKVGMLVNSRAAYGKLMTWLNGDNFEIEVK
jgi:hypothetical protein